MRSKPIIGAAGILILASLLIALVVVGVPVAEGREARQVLQAVLAQIETPEPGQIVHLSYTWYHRGPPAGLEPADPYHLPYKEIWPVRQIEDTWLEVDAQGETVRWRTQLRSEEGELLQDLMFDHGIETDYSPQEDKAYRYAMQAGHFRDQRVALIEDFLEQESLFRRQTIALDGRSVMSVYAEAIDLEGSTWASQGIEAALLSFSRPFVADLQPRSQAMRLDFDLASFMLIGEARVVWDQAGAEHVVSYRTLSEPNFVSDGAAQADRVFRQEIPEHAFQELVLCAGWNTVTCRSGWDPTACGLSDVRSRRLDGRIATGGGKFDDPRSCQSAAGLCAKHRVGGGLVWRWRTNDLRQPG
ncbi:MAG: hypothetical protein V9H69_22210 [Anaerolineae bacterium]